VDDCKNFLNSPEKWAERAARLGWDAMALFGCASNRPLDYFGSAGLVWAINGARRACDNLSEKSTDGFFDLARWLSQRRQELTFLPLLSLLTIRYVP
jgi:hypothetical protein